MTPYSWWSPFRTGRATTETGRSKRCRRRCKSAANLPPLRVPGQDFQSHPQAYLAQQARGRAEFHYQASVRYDSLVERDGFELPVPLVFLSNRGFSGSFVFSVGADRRSRRKRNGREAGYFRLNRRNRQFESIPLPQAVHSDPGCVIQTYRSDYVFDAAGALTITPCIISAEVFPRSVSWFGLHGSREEPGVFRSLR
jgi:hypothetical protein